MTSGFFNVRPVESSFLLGFNLVQEMKDVCGCFVKLGPFRESLDVNDCFYWLLYCCDFRFLQAEYLVPAVFCKKTRVELAKVLPAHLDPYREIRDQLGYSCH